MSAIITTVESFVALGDHLGAWFAIVSLSAAAALSSAIWGLKRLRAFVLEWSKLLDAMAAVVEKWRRLKRAFQVDDVGPKKAKRPKMN